MATFLYLYIMSSHYYKKYGKTKEIQREHNTVVITDGLSYQLRQEQIEKSLSNTSFD